MFNIPGKVAILGSGSWATAVAKIVQMNGAEMYWLMRSQEKIEQFKEHSHNPGYLSNVRFDTDRIVFTTDINEAITNCDTIIFAMPSPYLKANTEQITVSFENKIVVSVIKGIVAGDNIPISEYLQSKFNLADNQVATLSGPSHAEEVAFERHTYLTVGCKELESAGRLAEFFANYFVHTTTSTDILGVQYAGVLKNIYAIASGIICGLKYGDNFHAVLVANAIREMKNFLNHMVPL